MESSTKSEILNRVLSRACDSEKDWKNTIIKRPSLSLLFNSKFVNLSSKSSCCLAVNELRKKFDSHWNSSFSSSVSLCDLIDSDFIDRSKKIISNATNYRGEIPDSTAIYCRLASPPAIFNKFQPLGYSLFPTGKSFVSYNRYTYLIKKAPETLDKMQYRFLMECADSVPIQEVLIEKLAPVYTGYLNLLDELVLGTKYILRDRLRQSNHKKLLIKNLPELKDDEDQLTYLLKQSHPTLEEDRHDKAIEILPPLYVLACYKWTNPKYSFGNSSTKSSILDAYYWTNDKESRLVSSLNTMESEDLDAYILSGFAHCNETTEEAYEALGSALRVLLVLDKKINPNVIDKFKSVYKKRIDVDKEQILSLRKGLSIYTRGHYFISPQRMSEHEAKKTMIKNKKKKNKEEMDKKSKQIALYSSFLKTCIVNGIKPSKDLFQEVESGRLSLKDLSNSSPSRKKPSEFLKKLNDD